MLIKFAIKNILVTFANVVVKKTKNKTQLLITLTLSYDFK